MKLKHILTLLGVSFSLAAVGAVGVAAGEKWAEKDENLVAEVKADATKYYFKSDKEGWDENNGYAELDGDVLVKTIQEGDNFKFHDGGSSWLGISSVAGSAAGLFSGSDNIYANVGGEYVFTIATVSGSTKIYIDYSDGTEMYIVGTTTDNGGRTSSWADQYTTKGISVNGATATTFTFAKNDEIKVVKGLLWDHCTQLGYGDLKHGDFYGSFTYNGSNVKVSIAGSYDAKVILNNHSLSLKLYPTGADPDDTNFIYVLDKYGNCLSTYHQAYTFDSHGRQMGWPGATMDRYTDTNHLYELEYWIGMETVIFNNKHGEGNNEGTQSWDWTLSEKTGLCLVLTDHTDGYGKWDSNTWISLAAAKFIENCLHFVDVPETNENDTGACKGNTGYWKIAESAFNALTPAQQAEALSVDGVEARLNAWEAAYNASLEAGTLSFAINNENGSSSSMIIVIASTIAVISIIGFVVIKRRKENA